MVYLYPYVPLIMYKKSWAEFFKHLQIKDKNMWKADEHLILQECDQKSDQKST